jgi:hypothetical protein
LQYEVIVCRGASQKGEKIHQTEQRPLPGEGRGRAVELPPASGRSPATNRRSVVSIPGHNDTEQGPAGSELIIITALTLLLAAVIVVVTRGTTGLADVIPLVIIAAAVSSRRQR